MTDPRSPSTRWFAAAVSGVALAAASLVLAPTTAGAQTAPDPDAALVQQTCTACHGASQFTSRRQTREAWAATVRLMVGYGADVPDEKAAAIVNYLTLHYGPTTPPARPGG
jgi:hypothetical protein